MNYKEEITRILAEAGEEGLSVQKVALHVHHACNSLFETVPFEVVRTEVSRFLMRNSKQKGDLIEHMNKRGMYRLNPHSSSAMQLVLQFKDENCTETTPENQAEQDFSLSLF